jgi:DNA polymerase-1
MARALFIPRKDCVLYFPDYSQIEVWISAYCSSDKIMKEYLVSGGDMHGALNEQFFGTRPDFEEKKGTYRKKIKGLTFATIYGAGAGQLSEMGLGLSLHEAQDFISLFFTKYYGLYRYKNSLMQVASELGYIEDPFGKRCYIPSELSFKSLNYMIQGSASGVMKRAIINVSNLCKARVGMKLLLTIHDELCIEVPLKLHSKKIMREIISAMQGDFHQYFGMESPFAVSMAMTYTNWAEKFEVEDL